MVAKGEADSLICGTVGPYRSHLNYVLDLFGLRPGVRTPAAMSVLILPRGPLFIADTYVQPDPTADQIADICELAAEEMRRFGVTPKAALVSHSNFGTLNTPSAVKLRQALSIIHSRLPELEVDGEMHADAALSEEIRRRTYPDSQLTGDANLLIMPTLDAANIAFNMVKTLDEAVSIGPILMGVTRPAHIVTPSVTVRGIVNMAALASLDARVAQETPPPAGGTRPGYIPSEEGAI
jgi:malate dehydrogenase (oxaloacetate-decarboxylating)(NADP+)